jgi:hypothetical protein
MPAGPGARELTEFFAHVDGKLTTTDARAPKTQASDRDVLNLMTKRARTLHLGVANYCWFTDPSRALCLKLAAEFEQRLQAVHQAGNRPDPRDAQITRLKNQIAVLKERLTQATGTIDELTDFRTRSLAQLAAQHDEISRLRTALSTHNNVRGLPQWREHRRSGHPSVDRPHHDQ